MKTSYQKKIEKIVELTVKTYLNEAQKYDISAAMRGIQDFNRGNLNIEDLSRYVIKQLGFRLTPFNIENTENHFIACAQGSDRLPLERQIVIDLYQFLK